LSMTKPPSERCSKWLSVKPGIRPGWLPVLKKALEILRKEYIPALFIDLGLERMNGFELGENIRKINPKAIIYALTGNIKIFGPREMLETGFDNYFAKPISLKDIHRAVKESFIKLDSYRRARKQGGDKWKGGSQN
jgi:DNA-binding response OmpR family regulator